MIVHVILISDSLSTFMLSPILVGRCLSNQVMLTGSDREASFGSSLSLYIRVIG